MDKLLSKGQIGNMKLKNRVFMAPMGTTGEADGSYNMNSLHYFEERAKGGTGLIITGANIVSTKYEPRPCTELSGFHNVERLSMLVERCHHHGSKVCVQLSPGLGRMVFTDPFTPPYSASECQSFWFEDLKCKPLEVEDIHYLTEKMAYGASLAQAAGADAVEIHAYGGYLLDQFHSKLWNKRTDEYGGSLENRMRFTLEIIAAIRATCGEGLPIIVKFTAIHGVEGGRELDEGVEMAKIFQEAGADALHVDVGCYEAWYKAISTVYSEKGHQLEACKAVKEVSTIPVLGQGKLSDPVLASQVIDEGTLDFVGLGHQMLADPYWVTKVEQGRFYDIVPCIGCNECLLSGFSGKHYYCAVNPLCYAENDYQLTETEKPNSKVLVIGGGPGGMQAAMTAAERGFQVELWEKSDRLGGNLWGAGLPSFKRDVLKLIKYMETQLYKHNVNIRLMKDASPEEIIAGDFDKVILATGANSIVPRIKGVEHAVISTEILTDKIESGKNVVVIGGGLVGCETAALCKQTADKVTIIETLDDILVKTNHCRNNDQHLRQLLQDEEVEVISKAAVTSIAKDNVEYTLDDKTHKLDCDMVVLACGYNENNALEAQLEGKVKSLDIIGDAQQPDNIMKAVHQGYHAIRLMD